jgi:imidazolonepropionase-like amidohydrolase
VSSYIIRARQLIDGTGNPAVANPAVVVTDGKITGVFQGAVPEGAAPAGAKVLEYPEATLLPGLMDSHVHLNLPGDGTDLADWVREPDGVLVAVSATNARTALDAGITALRDCGGRETTTFELRRALDLGFGKGPRLVLCGSPITITGGHCRYFGGEADGVEGVRQKARAMVKKGADYIKVMATGGGTPGTMSWLPSFRREEILALADEAHRLGRKIGIHALCAESIQYCVEAGVDQIEHAGFITDAAGTQRFRPEIAEQIAGSGAVVAPTMAVGLYVIKRMEAKERRTKAEQALLDRWLGTMESNLAQFRGLLKAGVKFVAGTDAGWRFTPFDSLPDELELMVQGGLSPMAAIVSATSAAAKALGIEHTVGVVRAGLEADIIAVQGDPLEQIGALKQVRLVMKAGRIHKGE